MRKAFFRELHKHMGENENIYALTGDLGMGGFDQIQKDYPDRFINCGASEQSLIGAGVGIALKGKISVCYSITPFLLYRPLETIRNYLSNEEIPVKLVGSGRDKDYLHDGFSHWGEEAFDVLNLFPNIVQIYPEEEKHIVSDVRNM